MDLVWNLFIVMKIRNMTNLKLFTMLVKYLRFKANIYAWIHNNLDGPQIMLICLWNWLKSFKCKLKNARNILSFLVAKNSKYLPSNLIGLECFAMVKCNSKIVGYWKNLEKPIVEIVKQLWLDGITELSSSLENYCLGIITKILHSISNKNTGLFRAISTSKSTF